jgi:hypothetical protein
MPSILLTRFASLLRRWIAYLDPIVSNPHRLTIRDQSLDFRGRDAAPRPAHVRVRRERDRT